MTAPDLRDAIAAACDLNPAAVRDLAPTAGGDISLAHTARVGAADAFIKTVDPAVPGLLAAEADGLRWLAEPGSLRVPEVLGVLDEVESAAAGLPEVLVLERLHPASPASDHDECLGRGLAAIHRAGAPQFGAPWPSFIGRLGQPRAITETSGAAEQAGEAQLADGAAAFLARCRWWPIARLAEGRGALPPGTLDALEDLTAVLAERLGAGEPPARIHGDLWAGNAITDEHGAPVLIDPSAHGGLREADLAMMHLFGGFSPTVFAAYEEVHPLTEGHAERVGLHQIHPLLVHAALFGGGYGERARRLIDRCR